MFNSIRRAKPSILFISADGPRSGNEKDHLFCAKVLDIVEKIDWKCEVKTFFRKENLGCKVAITSANDWFFNHVDEGIILEDDCLPSKSFFRFCQDLLEKYRNNDRVMQINGSFYLDNLINPKESYYFSKIISCWGWATWKSSWGSSVGTMSDYERLKNNGLIEKYYNNNHISNWMERFFNEKTGS